MFKHKPIVKVVVVEHVVFEDGTALQRQDFVDGFVEWCKLNHIDDMPEHQHIGYLFAADANEKGWFPGRPSSADASEAWEMFVDDNML